MRRFCRATALILVTSSAALLVAAVAGAGPASAATAVPVGPQEFAGNVGQQAGLAFSPDGTLVAAAQGKYVNQNGTVTLFEAPSTNPLSYASALTPLPGTPIATGMGPFSVAFSPGGTLLAIANQYSDSVSMYQVHPTDPTAALQPVLGSPFPTGNFPENVAFSPDGTLLAVPNEQDNTISLFSVSSSGVLTPAPNSPFPVPLPSGGRAFNAKFSPSGQYLAVTGGNANTVSMFSVSEGSGGPSLSEIANSPFPLKGQGATTLSFNSTGSLLAVAEITSNTVSMLSVASSGQLTEVAGSPFSVGASTLTDAEFSPSGHLLATADENNGNPNSTVFFVDPTTGALTQLAVIKPVNGDVPQSVTWAPQNTLQGDVLALNSGDFQLYSTGPFATITSPANGATYSEGQYVTAGYSCDGVQYVVTCLGTVPLGSFVDTSSPGTHTFNATAIDLDGYSTTSTVTYMVSAPTPPPCLSQVSFELTHVTGCLTPQSNGTYTATSTIHLNGVPITPVAGHPITITPGNGSGADPGGQIGVGETQIALGSQVLYDGALNVNLPAGGSGDEGQLVSLSANPVSLFGFTLGGNFTLSLGEDSRGYYSTFTLTVDLPKVFQTAIGGGMTGTGSVRVDDNGTVEYNGMQISASNLSIGPLTVNSVCFSLIPGGTSDVNQCATPSLSGSFTGDNAYLSCNSSPGSADHWAATAEITLPTPSKATFDAFGAGVGTTFTDLGATGTNLDIPIAEGVDINTLGAGICFPTSAQPLTIRGDLGLGLFPVDGNNLVSVDGTVIYTNSTPWTLQVGGAVSVYQVGQVATGNVEVYGNGDFTFNAALAVSFGPSEASISLNGGVSGWVEPQYRLFDLEGNVSVCASVLGLQGCAGANGVVSTTGVAGCIQVGPLQFGAGYTWSDRQLTTMGPFVCGVGAWQATMAASDAAAGSKTFTVAPDTRGVAFRVFGRSGPPRVKITGPAGTRIASPSKGGLVKGPNYLLLEDGTNKTTNVGIASPPAGTYTVTSLDPGNPVTRLQTAPVLAAFSGHGTVTSAAHGRRALRLSYVLPTGARLALVEHGAKAEHTIARDVHGKACPGGHEHVDGGTALCYATTFVPTRGPGGARNIFAVISERGIPVTIKQVSSYTAPTQTRPSKPGELQLQRKGTTVTIVWSPSSGTSRYGVAARTSQGGTRSFFLAASCRAVKLTGIPSTVGITAGVAGIRYDGVHGGVRAGTLKARKSSGGSAGKKLGGRLCR